MFCRDSKRRTPTKRQFFPQNLQGIDMGIMRTRFIRHLDKRPSI